MQCIYLAACCTAMHIAHAGMLQFRAGLYRMACLTISILPSVSCTTVGLVLKPRSHHHLHAILLWAC